MPESLNNDQINRLWEYRLHIENIYYNRHNFFLVFQSVLLGVFGILFSRMNTGALALKVVAILGLSLTIIWGYAQTWQLHTINDLRTYLKELVPEYRAIRERRNTYRWPIYTLSLITYAIPTLVALIWIAFLFIA